MKRKALILCVVLLAAVSVFCISYSPIRLRLYPGDRIQGSLRVSVDGKTVALNKENVNSNKRFDVRMSDDGSIELFCRAGEYGDYAFELLTDQLAQPIAVHCFQHNWWNLQRFALQIQIDTVRQSVTYSGFCSGFGDDGIRAAETINQTQAISEEELQIQIGL